MTIYHIHHIKPRHVGGTDNPSNLIKLTIKQHTLAHKKLWEQYGREKDKIAWLSLSGQISYSVAKKLAILDGQRRGAKTTNTKYWTKERLVKRNKARGYNGKNNPNAKIYHVDGKKIECLASWCRKNGINYDVALRGIRRQQSINGFNISR